MQGPVKPYADDKEGSMMSHRLALIMVIITGFVVALLTGCVASQTGGSTGLQPATDELFTAGDIQVAQDHLHAFGFDQGPVTGVFTAETQAAVQAYQGRYGLPVTGLLEPATRRGLLPGFDQRPKL
jgi:peptidoglycan hydrolase-like protein with peptidoglycan-binding domain